MEEHSLSEPAQRLALALALSFALHFALIYLVKVVPASAGSSQNEAIEVRLEESSRPDNKAALSALTQKQEQQPQPSLEPALPNAAESPAAEQKPETSGSPVPAEEESPLPSVEMPLVEDPAFYPGTQLDVQPTLLTRITQPEFPKKAENDNVSGEVTVQLLIDEFGKVIELTVVDAKPEGYFEESALNAFRNTRWVPAQREGRNVKSRMQYQISFKVVKK